MAYTQPRSLTGAVAPVICVHFPVRLGRNVSQSLWSAPGGPQGADSLLGPHMALPGVATFPPTLSMTPGCPTLPPGALPAGSHWGQDGALWWTYASVPPPDCVCINRLWPPVPRVWQQDVPQSRQ